MSHAQWLTDLIARYSSAPLLWHGGNNVGLRSVTDAVLVSEPTNAGAETTLFTRPSSATRALLQALEHQQSSHQCRTDRTRPRVGRAAHGGASHDVPELAIRRRIAQVAEALPNPRRARGGALRARIDRGDPGESGAALAGVADAVTI